MLRCPRWLKRESFGEATFRTQKTTLSEEGKKPSQLPPELIALRSYFQFCDFIPQRDNDQIQIGESLLCSVTDDLGLPGGRTGSITSRNGFDIGRFRPISANLGFGCVDLELIPLQMNLSQLDECMIQLSMKSIPLDANRLLGR
ncbi:hypothetical protein BBJ28_00011892 [Nothophytophthora sp. Chile5]|nr:hypothetical protein BBJ28_00011892 [Nothophytophthora sp. Chile5]